MANNTHLYDFDQTQLRELLAADKIEVSGGISMSAGSKIPPDTVDRTILIGLGGTGVKTLDVIKGALEKKLQPSWRQYIAFLAVDTDWNEFNGVSSLSKAEGDELCITLPHVDNRLHNKPLWPKPWQTFCDETTTNGIPGMAGPGANALRLVGKMKIHDKDTGAGVDEQIINAVKNMKAGRLAPLTGPGKYQVYVIGSVHGGTCSGSFLEMPALVRAGLGTNVQVNAMLYLPDTMSGKFTEMTAAFEANGYASLKELNYFEGLSMRKGYDATWYSNDPANSELKITADEDFFTMPFLIGSQTGPAADSYVKAQETIAEFFISVLGKMSTPGAGSPMMLESFAINARGHAAEKKTRPGNNRYEAQDEAHEFPRRFCALGFAQAAAPKQIISAYTVGNACRLAGLNPVDATTRAKMTANMQEIELLPFRKEDDWLTTSAGNRVAAEIIEPIVKLMAGYQASGFDYREANGIEKLEWKELHAGNYDDTNASSIANKYVADKTSTAELEKLDKDIMKAWAAFRENVKDYVAKEGPAAFCNVFEGKFLPEAGTDPIGIRSMLEYLRDGKFHTNGKPKSFRTAQIAEQQLKEKKKIVAEKKLGLLEIVKWAITRDAEAQVNEWETAYNNWVDARVNDVRREHMQGLHGQFAKSILIPATALKQQISCFGDVLKTMGEAYQAKGDKLNDYQEFRKFTDNSTEVNIAASNMQAFDWIKSEAEKASAKVNGKAIRKKLVDSFFENPDAWLDFEDSIIMQTAAGAVYLVNPDKPVSARVKFDECMNEIITDSVDASIENMFAAVQQRGVPAEIFAQQIIDQLDIASLPLFNGDTATDVNMYVMYPASLDAAVVQEIERYGKTKYNNAVSFYGTDYADSIMMYRQIAPFEIYKLRDLANWEKQYDVKRSPIYALHGRSPDTTSTAQPNGDILYTENLSWFDYPAITISNGDPTQLNAQGKRSAEGERRLKMKEILDKAKTYGVLYSKQTALGWKVYRVWCDGSRPNWALDIDMMQQDENGLMPMGEALAENVAVQNGTTLSQISREVCLQYGGVFDPAADCPDEGLAWERAYEVLYSHIPMFAQIRETTEKFEAWGKMVNEWNKVQLKKLNPAKLLRMVQGNVLYRDDRDWWYVNSEEIRKQVVAKMDSESLELLEISNPMLAAIVAKGFTFYYVYKQLSKKNPVMMNIMDNLDALAGEAKAYLEDPDDIAVVKACKALAAEMLAEADKLEELGANMAKPAKMTGGFKAKMAELLDCGEDEVEPVLKEMTEFYAGIRKWKVV